MSRKEMALTALIVLVAAVGLFAAMPVFAQTTSSTTTASTTGATTGSGSTIYPTGHHCPNMSGSNASADSYSSASTDK